MLPGFMAMIPLAVEAKPQEPTAGKKNVWAKLTVVLNTHKESETLREEAALGL